MKVLVPPAPVGDLEKKVGSAKLVGTKLEKSGAISKRPSQQLIAPLDAGFLGRTYITTLWLGAIFTLLVYGLTQSVMMTVSFAGGAVLGALLLKSQELLVRQVLRPKDKQSHSVWDARWSLAVLLPLKYLALGAAFWLLLQRGWMHPLAFAAGLGAEQVVIVSKVLGRFMALKMRAENEN